jgi:nitroimidazol reductase NimA-like FMN-containing flavoprotein (pyridoxamine 5'-phosphate oxidase superfamily)
MLIHEGLELLTRDQCIGHLQRGGVGRVGLTMHGLPMILPVNFVFLDGDVIFRTGEGTKLHAAADNTVVAFEIDAYDEQSESGWSVLVIGHSSTVTDQADLTRLAADHLRAWPDGTRASYVRVRPELLSGRRLPESSPGSPPSPAR